MFTEATRFALTMVVGYLTPLSVIYVTISFLSPMLAMSIGAVGIYVLFAYMGVFINAHIKLEEWFAKNFSH